MAGRIQTASFALQAGEQDVEIPVEKSLAGITSVELKTDNTEPQRLSTDDSRVVNFIIRNFRITQRPPA